MRIYSDSSWWIALKYQKDYFHSRACKIYEKSDQGEFLWTSWNEIEVLNCLMRGMDLFHVAIAIEIGADYFYTFDQDQEKLARKVGLKEV